MVPNLKIPDITHQGIVIDLHSSVRVGGGGSEEKKTLSCLKASYECTYVFDLT